MFSCGEQEVCELRLNNLTELTRIVTNICHSAARLSPLPCSLPPFHLPQVAPPPPA